MKDNITPKKVNFENQLNSKDFYKGTSFRWAGSWETGKLYANDTYFVDYVTYNKALWVCLKSHYSDQTSAPSQNSKYWQLVVDRGITGNPGVHVGPNPPTEEIYGPDYQNILWIDTTESGADIYKVYSAEEIDFILSEYVRKEDLKNSEYNGGDLGTWT